MWLPVMIIPVIVLIWRRSLQPLYQLLSALWQDWTLLSFAFYGTLAAQEATVPKTHNT